MLKLLREYWFSRPIKWALLETAVIGSVIWLGIMSFQLSHYLTVPVPNEWGLSSYSNLLCLSWLILRMVPPQRFWSKEQLKQLLATLLLFLLLEIFYIGAISFFLFAPSLVILSIVTGLFWICFFTGITRLVLFWDRRRKRSLYLTLIHAHSVVLALAAGTGFLIYAMLTEARPWPPLDFQFLAGVFFFILLFLPLLLLVFLLFIPPLILFAYVVIRPTTRRIGALVTVTNKLRAGYYDVRTPVEGQDEVAQLQKNFNVMADELEKTIRALEQERDHVAALLHERRELFANVSHELRTPIATLRGYLESDLDNYNQLSATRLRADLEVMEREVLQLQERADELFTLSRAEVEPAELALAPCDIRQLIQALVSSYAPLAWQTSRVEIIADIPDEVPLVNADRQRLEQALKNIVRNALRHTPPGGVIALTIACEEERVALSVEDTGEGIAPQDLAAIWQRFYQAGTARQRGGGAGIGLSLVKEWITGMGGSVSATSTPGEGSCFTLSLSRLRATSSPIRPDNEEQRAETQRLP